MMAQDHQIRRRPVGPVANVHSHARKGSNSSSNPPPPHHQFSQMHLQQPPAGHTRRTPSVNTFSTVSTNPPPAAFRTSPTSELRRSTSSRSGGQAMSYVALLRRQKATVWCDRTQEEDPRAEAQRRAAKQRAQMEVVGRSGAGRTATGLSGPGKVAAKIRHHGKPGVVGYTGDSNYIGVTGVPMRLSATEVEGEDSDEDDASQRMHHRRTGSSGRSSTASAGRRALQYRTSGASQGKKWSPGDTPEAAGSMLEQQEPEFTPGDDKILGRPQSTKSGSSAEKGDAVGDLGGSSAAKLASNSLLNAALTREKSVKNPEDLRRRGSVDERTMTLSTGRLFIANPD